MHNIIYMHIWVCLNRGPKILGRRQRFFLSSNELYLGMDLCQYWYPMILVLRGLTYIVIYNMTYLYNSIYIIYIYTHNCPLNFCCENPGASFAVSEWTELFFSQIYPFTDGWLCQKIGNCTLILTWNPRWLNPLGTWWSRPGFGGSLFRKTWGCNLNFARVLTPRFLSNKPEITPYSVVVVFHACIYIDIHIP